MGTDNNIQQKKHSKEGTSFQVVITNFQSKVPTYNGNVQMLAEYLKSAVAKCHRVTYDNLEFWYDPVLLDGWFYEKIHIDTVELLAMYMAQEYFLAQMTLYDTRKQYLGTQAFNKIPELKDSYTFVTSKYQFWSDEIRKLRDEFPDYSEVR